MANTVTGHEEFRWISKNVATKTVFQSKQR